MFNRFTERARKVIILSKEEARRFNHDYIGTEHLLLGLIREGEGVAAAVLQKLGLSLETIRIEVEKLVKPGPTTQILGDIPFLGYFFKHSSKTIVKKNLLIFITPKIVTPLMEVASQ